MALNYDIRRETHAIGEFSATLKFAGPVGTQAFANVLARLKEAAERLELPAPMNFQVLNFAIGDPNIPMPPPLAMSGGGFQRFLPNGEVACSLRCDPDSIIFSLREYDRWHNVLPKIVETFSAIGEAYLAEIPAIRSFGVQYLNEFRSKSPEFRDATELFKSESKWIASFAKGSDEAWHCHVGQFVKAGDNHRYLVNVNCDIAPNVAPGEQVAHNYARVLILAVRNYDLPDFGPLVVDVENLAKAIESNFDDAHSQEKCILGEVISDDYLAIMGEGANEH